MDTGLAVVLTNQAKSGLQVAQSTFFKTRRDIVLQAITAVQEDFRRASKREFSHTSPSALGLREETRYKAMAKRREKEKQKSNQQKPKKRLQNLTTFGFSLEEFQRFRNRSRTGDGRCFTARSPQATGPSRRPIPRLYNSGV